MTALMKKSRSIRLVLLGSAGITLAACGDDGPPQDAQFYSSVADCAAVYDTATCESVKAEAEQKFAEEAPKFTRKEECEAEFGPGNCETQQASSGGSIFMPMMMGYMMGSMLSGGNRFAQPVYRGANGSAVMPNGGKFFNVGSFGGTGAGAANSFRPAAQVSQVSRGGFGQSARAYRTTSGG